MYGRETRPWFEDIRVGPQIALQLVLAAGLQLTAFHLLVRGTGRFMPLRIEKEEEADGGSGAGAGAGAGAVALDGVALEEK